MAAGSDGCFNVCDDIIWTATIYDRPPSKQVAFSNIGWGDLFIRYTTVKLIILVAEIDRSIDGWFTSCIIHNFKFHGRADACVGASLSVGRAGGGVACER